LNYWHNSSPGLCIDFREFALFVEQLFVENAQPSLEKNFQMIESFMVFGDDEVKTATSTCLLENLLHRVSKTIPADKFVRLLGNESRAYCQAWDEYTGVTTEGL